MVLTPDFRLQTPDLFPVLRRVEPQNLLTLTRARVNGAEVLAALHLPDGRDLAVLLDGVVGDLFRGRGLLLLRRRAGRLARAFRGGRGVLVLCHVRHSPDCASEFLSLVCGEDFGTAAARK